MRHHSHLGGQNDVIVLGDVVAAGAQAVAVEVGADKPAVGECHHGRAVPRLHRAAVELVEGLLPLGNLRVALPRLGDHHHDCLVQRAATGVMQHLHTHVEVARVRVIVRREREELGGARAEVGGGGRALTGGEHVLVALQSVDLPVVAQHAVWLRARPAGERVRGEARVDQGHVRHVVLLLQVSIVLEHLCSGELPLVGDCTPGECAHVEIVQRGAERLRPILGYAASHVKFLLEVCARETCGLGDEELLDQRLCLHRHLTERRVVGGRLAPAEHLQALRLDRRRQQVLGLVRRVGVNG
mmetsp:Transcript_26960/g.68266  ORF Transcript_26960/g.68266 Transcript_26960/m.68266 type:complete len:299 (+) Transcript_26960:3679-4575(+)